MIDENEEVRVKANIEDALIACVAHELAPHLNDQLALNDVA